MGQNVFAEDFKEDMTENYSESVNDKDTSFIVKYKDGTVMRNGVAVLSNDESVSGNMRVVTYDEEKRVLMK